MLESTPSAMLDAAAADDNSPSTGSSPSASTSPDEALLPPVPPPVQNADGQDEEAFWTQWPDSSAAPQSSIENQRVALEMEVEPSEKTLFSTRKLPKELSPTGQHWDSEPGSCRSEELPITWGSASFEYHEQGWLVKLPWAHTGSSQGKQTYSLHWRRNLEPWVLHKGSLHEVQLKEIDAVASYWFILRAEELEGDSAITSPVLGPLTPPSAPNEVRHVNAVEIAPGTIEVSWRPPLACCGGSRVQVTDYEVLLENERQQLALTVCRGTRVQINNVDTEHCYTVHVCAVSGLLGRGPYCMAAWPINIRHATLPALPIDGCPTQSWNHQDKTPIPAEWRHWWPLDIFVCLSALLATMAFDMELAASTYSMVEEPLCMALLLSAYLLCGALATRAADAVERFLPPCITVFLAKLAYVQIAAMYHLYVHAQSGQPAWDFRGWGAEHLAMQWSLNASEDFFELSALGLSRQMAFLVCLRGSAGGFAAVVRHLTLHVMLPSKASSIRRWTGIVVSVLHSKSAPLGFACVAVLLASGFGRADAPYMLARGLVIMVALSAFLGLLLGPHGKRPAAALSLSQVSMRVVLRRCRSLCEENVRRAIHNLVSAGQYSFAAEVSDRLENWDGPNRAIWLWSARSILLLDDQSPLLGLKNSCVLPTLVALLQRQLLGAEEEIIESFACARSHALKQSVPAFSAQAQRIVLDVLTIAAALGEPPDDLKGVFNERRKKIVSSSVDKCAKELYSVGDLYQALERISEVSHVAVPCRLLATTYIVTRTSQRSWLTCLGCVHCCRIPVLQHRLAVDRAKHILHLSADELQCKVKQDTSPPLFDTSAPLFDSSQSSVKTCNWCGACPRWADIAACGEQHFLQSLDNKYAGLIRSLFCLTGGTSCDSIGSVAAERRGGQFREFLVRYEEHIGQHFVSANDAIALSVLEVNVAAAVCSEALLAAGVKKEAQPLGYALSCLIQGKDTSAVSGHLNVGLCYCAKELLNSAIKCLPKRQSGKDKKIKQLYVRVPRVLEALLRIRFFGISCWTERIAYDVYTLAVEWCALCGGGPDSFDVHDFLLITDLLRPGSISSPDVGGAHLRRPLEVVFALCNCESRAMHELFTALLADVGINTGNALAAGMLSLIAWLDAERAELQNRITNSASVLVRGCSSPDTDPIGIDAIMLSAALALGFPSLTELSTIVGSCNILALHFGLSVLPADGGSGQIFIPGPGICLGSVLNLMQVVGQGPECPDRMLGAIADALAQHPRWQSFIDLVDRGKPCSFLGAIAARGGLEVPWAPAGSRDPEDVEVTRVLMDFYIRIVRSGCVPPPAPLVATPVPDKEDPEEWLIAYLACHCDGLVSVEDAMLLIQALTGEPCDAFTYTELCNQISRSPGVGLTVEDAKALLKELTKEQQQKLYHDLELGPGNYGEGIILRAHKHRQLLEKKVKAATLSAWSLTDTLALWLTHFFGPRAAQAGLVLPDESADGASSVGGCCSCCGGGTAKQMHASEIRGLLALQARPEELARSWRAAVARGVASLPAQVRAPRSRLALGNLLGIRRSHAGQRLHRILPYNARAQLLAHDVESGSSLYEGVKRHFHNDLCHSRTEMCQGGLRRDESRNLATLRRESTRWRHVYALRIDPYTLPSLVYVAVLAVYEVALLLLLPQFLLSHDKIGGSRIDGNAARAAVAAGVLASLFLGQACGSWHQGRRARAVNMCPLPVPIKDLMVAINGWETDSLAVSVLTAVGAALQSFAWQATMPAVGGISMLTVAAFLLGICRPLAETALILRPRCGHSDGYPQAASLNSAFLWRTVVAAVGLPLLLWYLGVEADIRGALEDEVGKVSIDQADNVLLLVPAAWQQHPRTGAALCRLGHIMSLLSILALTPWLVSALNLWPYMHPVRRALHYIPPARVVGSGGPPIEGHPVVSYVTMRSLIIKWSSPCSTRTLVYDVQVSVDYGIWQPGKNFNIAWLRDRRDCSCRIAIRSISPGEAVRFRVRCAPVDSLANLQNAERGKEELIWGPWSKPSSIIQRPGEVRPPLSIRPLIMLILTPVFLAHVVLYSLPAAWLGQVVEKPNNISLRVWRYALLLVIWPMVCIHLFCWEFPLWAKERLRRRNSGHNVVCMLPLLVVLVPHLLLTLIYWLNDSFRKSKDVEMLPLLHEFGPVFALVVAKSSVEDIVGSNDIDEGSQSSTLRLAGFEDDILPAFEAKPASYQHASRIKLSSTCTKITLSVCTIGKDNIHIECVLYMYKESDALDRCVGASIIERAEEMIIQESSPSEVNGKTPASKPSWMSSKRLPFENCMVLVSSEVSADAKTLTSLCSDAAAQGAVGIILVLHAGSSVDPHISAPSLDLPLFCITNEAAVKLQDQLARSGQHAALGGIALRAEGHAVEAVNASWKSTSTCGIGESLALQFRPSVGDYVDCEDQWKTCAVMTAQSSSILVVLPIGEEDYDEFRLLGHAKGAWQPLSLYTSLSITARPGVAAFEYTLGERDAAADKKCSTCGNTSKADAKFCFHCGERWPDRHEAHVAYATQVLVQSEGLSKLRPVVAQLARKKSAPPLARVKTHHQKSMDVASASAPENAAATAGAATPRHRRHGMLSPRSVPAENRSAAMPSDSAAAGAAAAGPSVSMAAGLVNTVVAAARSQKSAQADRDSHAHVGAAALESPTPREPTDPGCDFGASASMASGYCPAFAAHAGPSAAVGGPLVGSNTWLTAGAAATRATRPQRYNNIDWLG